MKQAILARCHYFRAGSAKHAQAAKAETARPDPTKPATKRRPKFIVEAMKLVASDTSDGKVHRGGLGLYLKRTDPAFSPQTYGHSGLLDMLRTYDLLVAQQDPGCHWSVSLSKKAVALKRRTVTPPTGDDHPQNTACRRAIAQFQVIWQIRTANLTPTNRH